MELKMTLQSPGVVERVWYRRLRLALPLSTGSTAPWHANWVRLLPYRWRRIHKSYATVWGFFWLPCPLCDRPFGGHEHGMDIPDPTRAPSGFIMICSRCTIKRAA